MNILNPVILPVPESMTQVMGKEKVQFLSAHARLALQQSAALSQVSLGELNKNAHGMPLPSQGVFWSISHKPHYVAGVVSDQPVGIDIEHVREITPGLIKKVANQKEWDMGKEKPKDLFFRYWTAKEAVIKTQGTGIKDLLKCRVIDIPDPYNLVIAFCNEKWIVEHTYFDGHMAAVVKNDCKINWMIMLEE